ncbi:MAG TPA: MBL fold metallo-hydrolase [Ferruginibacter sp.]|nr:MBL fold metallo-hydrolase [Ferruginibacter sp.]
MEVYPLSEGSFTIDGSKVFVPFNKATDDLQQRPVGSLLVEIQPFLVRTSKDILLLDTGLGFTNPAGYMQIWENIEAWGMDGRQVTKVLLSHLHRDHAGGILHQSSPGKITTAFPHATYYVNREEWNLATQHPNKSYDLHTYAALEQTGQLQLMESEGTIDGYISYVCSGGHSPHHTVFTIRENNEIVFFGGDVAPQLQQMKNRFVAKYDFDGKLSMELRRQWWEQGQSEHWKFLFYHDIKTPTIQL